MPRGLMDFEPSTDIIDFDCLGQEHKSEILHQTILKKLETLTQSLCSMYGGWRVQEEYLILLFHI